MHMKKAAVAVAVLSALGANALAQTCPDYGPALTYPVTKKSSQSDNYHGTTIADPYRWLEDANSAETQAWVTAQNKVTQAYLATIDRKSVV